MIAHRPENPLVVQGDPCALAEVASARFPEARNRIARIARFAELVKPFEQVHTCRITPLLVCHACALERQLFLCEQGYACRIADAGEIAG